MVLSFEAWRTQSKTPTPHWWDRIELQSFVEKKSSNCPPEVATHFSQLAQLPFLEMKEGQSSTQRTPLRVGVLLSGGPAPGGHNVLCGLWTMLHQWHPNSLLYGFRRGVEGLLQGEAIEIQDTQVEQFYNTGGFDFLGSSRKKIEHESQYAAVEEVLRQFQLNGLVIIGGDDSNTNAAFLAQYLATRGDVSVIGVPKTIDGDLTTSDLKISFGFDTATRTYSHLISNLCRDAISTGKYYHFVRLMGRKASHITLECALHTHPNVTLISEEMAHQQQSLEDIIEQITHCILERARHGKHYGVILIPEGLLEWIPTIHQDLQAHAGADHIRALLQQRDEHGHPLLSQIQTEQLLIACVRHRLSILEPKLSFHAVGHFFGYEGRCAYPSPFDAMYGQALGGVAALLIAHQHTGYMAALNYLEKEVTDWQAVAIPLSSMLHREQRGDQEKLVIARSVVDLDGESFGRFASARSRWLLEDDYRYVGPIQYQGPHHVIESRPSQLWPIVSQGSYT